MPVKIRCKKCGYVLGDWPQLPGTAVDGRDWIDNLLYKYKGKCPKCGHKLPTRLEFANKMNTEIKDAKEAPRNLSCIVVKLLGCVVTCKGVDSFLLV